MMLVGKPLPFIVDYVEKLSTGLEQSQRQGGLTMGQRAWLSFCLMCVIVTESVCGRKFVRAGLGRYSEALLSFYFRCPLSWGGLIALSIRLVLESFETWEGILVIDDSGKKRSKTTQRIPYVHYYKDKEGTGTLRGQETVFVVLVTPVVTIPVGDEFYQPDPAYSAWSKQDKRLRKQGVPKAMRPKPPAPNASYPTQQPMALGLLEQFKRDCPYVKVKAVLADALYGNADFMDKAALLFAQTQVISQPHANQNVRDRRRSWKLEAYFKAYPGVPKTLAVRGGKTQNIIVGSARLYVEAQQGVRFVVAIRYSEEQPYRYLVASDLSWRTEDIAKAYTLRGLVETVIEDLKVHEGWGQSTKQPGVEGSRRVLTLSLLCDHCLILHPEQQARATAKQPLSTKGHLQRRLKITALTAWLEQWLEGEALNDKIAQLTEAILPRVPLQDSDKHMSGRDLGRLESTAGLQYRAKEVHAEWNVHSQFVLPHG